MEFRNPQDLPGAVLGGLRPLPLPGPFLAGPVPTGAFQVLTGGRRRIFRFVSGPPGGDSEAAALIGATVAETLGNIRKKFEQ